jgi:hypothetical protein
VSEGVKKSEEERREGADHGGGGAVGDLLGRGEDPTNGAVSAAHHELVPLGILRPPLQTVTEMV